MLGFETNPYNVLEDVGVVQVCLVKRNSVQLGGSVNILLTTGPAPFDPDKDPATGKSDSL